MLTFNLKYFGLAVLLFIVEVVIAVYINDTFVRPYFGDFLVVILLYCFVKSFCKAPVKAVALSVLLFAYMVEVLQYFKFVKHLGLEKSKLANVILGNSFAWNDLLAYTLGVLFVLLIEKMTLLSGGKKVNAPST